ncbi:ABC transporter permease [Prauserella muralis]|uniref:Peptide ABC transporter permease n=1 Tax=Prauserella muralis TaxID=588067 RepID=A0A2V4ATG9_9PSEU|nr:ABC transporter permease [Prauserella muralis]PXY24720.1 peptide ABC transporter permease [Prauserella muralis]TWE27702.1 peptide/nickel transport system permease protein [Prauserella muralis]
MLRFLVRRLPSVVFVLLATTVVAFLLPRLAPGDPASVAAGPEATPEQIAALRIEMGLDRPLIQQYLDWMGGLFTGQLGESLQFRRPVSELIGARLESTVELTVAATLLMIVVGIGLGVFAGSARSRWSRFTADATNTTLLAMPPFLAGLLLVILLGVTFRVLPISGEVAVLDDPVIGLQYLILPAIALAVPMSGSIAMLVQSSMDNAWRQDYVDLAVAKGVGRRRIAVRHVVRNSLGPAVVAIGIRFGEMLAGAVVIEMIFARNGLGQLAVTSVQSADYNVVQVLIVGAVVIAVVVQLLTEIAMATLDPRVRLGV